MLSPELEGQDENPPISPDAIPEHYAELDASARSEKVGLTDETPLADLLEDAHHDPFGEAPDPAPKGDRPIMQADIDKVLELAGFTLPDDARYSSELLGCSIRKWRSLRETLVQLGKPEVSGKFLTNKRAEEEIENLTKLQDKQRENRARSNENNDLQKRPFDQPEPKEDNVLRRAREEVDDRHPLDKPDRPVSFSDVQTERDQVLEAICVDSSGVIGPS